MENRRPAALSTVAQTLGVAVLRVSGRSALGSLGTLLLGQQKRSPTGTRLTFSSA